MRHALCAMLFLSDGCSHSHRGLDRSPHLLSQGDPVSLGRLSPQCQKKGFKEVRIIHGKGKGVQMNIVHSFLERSPLVESFKLAPPEAGSWGATIAVLKEAN